MVRYFRIFWGLPLALFLFSSLSALSQLRKYEIKGTIDGPHIGNIYLFFEGNYRKKDSLAAIIKDGEFSFTGQVTLPVLARIHLGQKSYIADIFLDSPHLYIECVNTLQLSNNNADTLNQLIITNVKGSRMDKTLREFNQGLSELKKSSLSDDEKQNLLFQKMSLFLEANKHSKIAPYSLSNAVSLSYSQLYELNQLIDSSLQNSFEGKMVKRLLSSRDRSKYKNPGMKFYDVSLADTSGQVYSTKNIQGKYTLYDFWASWCGPCRANHPALSDFYNRNKNKGLEIVSISLDENEQKWKESILKDNLNWTQLVDLSGFKSDIAQYYGIDVIPFSLFVDANGKIVGANMTIDEMEHSMEKR